MFTNTLLNSRKITTKLSYLYSELNPVNLLLFLILLTTYLILMGSAPKIYIHMYIILIILDNINIFVSYVANASRMKSILRHFPFNIWFAFLWILLCLGLTGYKCVRLLIVYFSSSRWLTDDINNFFIYHPATEPYANTLSLLLPEVVTTTVLFTYLMVNTNKMHIRTSSYKIIIDMFRTRRVQIFKHLVNVLIFVAIAISVNVFTIVLSGFFVLKTFQIQSHKKLLKNISAYGLWITSIAALIVPIIFVNYNRADLIDNKYFAFLGLFNLVADAGHIFVPVDFENRNSYLLLVIFALFYITTKMVAKLLTKEAIRSNFASEKLVSSMKNLSTDFSLMDTRIIQSGNKIYDRVKVESRSLYMNYFIKRISVIMNIDTPDHVYSSKYIKNLPGLDFKLFSEAFREHQVFIDRPTRTKFSFFTAVYEFLKRNKLKLYSFVHVCTMLVVMNFLQNLYTLLFLVYLLMVILHDLNKLGILQIIASWTLRITSVICFGTFILANTQITIFSESIKQNFWFNFFGFHSVENKFQRILITFLLMAILQLNHHISSYAAAFGIGNMLEKYFDLNKPRSFTFKLLVFLYYPSRFLFYVFLIILEAINGDYTFFRLFSLVLYLFSIHFDLQRKNNYIILKLLVYLYMIVRFTFFIIFQAKLLNPMFANFFEIYDNSANFFSSSYFNFLKLIILGVLIKLRLLKSKFEQKSSYNFKILHIDAFNSPNFVTKIFIFLSPVYMVLKPYLLYLIIMIGFAKIQINLIYILLFCCANFLLYYEEANYFFLFKKYARSKIQKLEGVVLATFYMLLIASIAKILLYLFMLSN